MDGSVDNRGGHGSVCDDGGPAGEFQVCCIDDGLSFVGVSDDLVEQSCSVVVYG